MKYALAAKGVLGKNLKRAIQEKGPSGAIEFCKVEASKLTDSVSLMNNAVVRRVSDKPRNPDNAANTIEKGYITYYKKLIVAGKKPEAIVNVTEEEVDFYYPIITDALCLQCHGTPQGQVRPETLAVLKSLYPTDMATGYGRK